MQIKNKINWTVSLFLIINTLVGVIGSLMLGYFDLIKWQTVVLALILMIFGGLSITVGYHRLFSHATFKAAWPLRFILLFFGASVFEGSCLEWSTDHRDHHRYTDTDKDPYSISKGFWWAHMGWLFFLDQKRRNFNKCADLQKDPLVRWQHRLFIPIAILSGYLLPMSIALLWHDALGAMIIAGALRIALNQQATFCVNSICHFFGTKKYSNEISARDNWFTSLYTFGEGYHNFHHQFPSDYRNGIRSYDFDPSKWLIHILKWLGLAKDLKRIKSSQIIKYKVKMEQPHLQQVWQKVSPAYDAVLQSLKNLNEIESAYQVFKTRRDEFLNKSLQEYRRICKEYRLYIKKAKQEMKYCYLIWKNQIKKPELLNI